MTTEIKALRPCILPKGWVLENNIKQLDVSEIFQVSHVHYRNNEYGIVLRDREHNCLASLQLDFDETVEKDIIYPIVQLKIQEIIQAIASAQRPWLKAEGFEFVEGALYEAVVLGCDTYSVAGKCFYSDGEAYLNVEDARENFSLEEETYAFKPIVPFYSTVEEKQAIWDSFKTVKAVYFGKPTQNKFINCFNCIV